jgi:hypothetical protein
LVDWIGRRAAALVFIESDSLVAVPHDCRNRLQPDAIGDFVGRGTVADQIAEAAHTLDVLADDVRQEGLQRRQIAVNVVQSRGPHGAFPCYLYQAFGRLM